MRLARTRNFARVLAELADAPLSYPEHGATAGKLPPGYHHLRVRTQIGHGMRSLTKAGDALDNWRMHTGAGLAAVADGPVEVGRTVVLGAGRPWSLVVPCRVVWTVAERREHGFAYGTLPGHPECGEESFVLTLDQVDALWLTVTAFSRPGSRLLRLAGPLNRTTQRYFTRRYAKALAREVSA